MTAEERLTVKAAAELLGVSKQTLDRWRVEGTGPRYLKLPGRVFYTRKDLDAFLAANTRTKTRG